MPDRLLAPAGAAGPAPPGDALLGALAMAAARIAAEQAKQAAPPTLTRADVEVIARAAVVEAFRQLDVDLDTIESVQAHRAALDHARRALAFWHKAAGTLWTGLWTAIAGGVIAAVVKYANIGGGK